MKFFSVALAGLIAVYALPAAAQYSCESEVSYKWKPAEDEEAEREVQWSVLQSSAEDEAAAKRKLSDMLMREKSKLREICIKRHENLAGCLASKLSSMESVLSTAGFKSRQLLEEAAQKDCQSQQGSCLAVTSSEIKCEAPAVEEDAEEEKEKKKGKGK
jgi:hypothetical protein